MGTYYRLICNEHKEVLDLNKSYDFEIELREYIYKYDLNHLIYEKEIIKFKEFSASFKKLLIDSKDILLSGIKQKEVIKSFLDKHKDCDLRFQPDEPWDEEIRKTDGWIWKDVFS